MNFGSPSLDLREPVPDSQLGLNRRVTVEGEYQLFVELADWTLEIRDSLDATSESSPTDIAKALSALDGQMLKAASFSSEPATSIFRFDLGAVLSLASYSDSESDMELWHIFHARCEIALLSPGEFVFANHETDEQRRWAFAQCEFEVKQAGFQGVAESPSIGMRSVRF